MLLPPVNDLQSKIEELLIRFSSLKDEISTLRQEIVTLKGQNDLKDIQILKLQEDLRNKDRENDDIFMKIEEVLGR